MYACKFILINKSIIILIIKNSIKSCIHGNIKFYEIISHAQFDILIDFYLIFLFN